MRKFLRGFELVIGALGLLAVVHLATINQAYPPLRIVQVSGQSMEPTLHEGEQLIFGRIPWQVGSIVLAEVGEDDPVIKRIVAQRRGKLVLSGDNREASTTYEVPPVSLIGTLFCRSPFRSPFAQGRADEGL